MAIHESSIEIERAREALSDGRYADAATLARTLAQLASTSDQRATWSDTAELLDRLAQAQPIAAFMLTHAIELADELHDSLLERLAGELERANEPLLAHAALDELWNASLVEADRPRLLRELAPNLAEDERVRTEAVAGRVTEHFRDAAEAGEVRALRASAWARRALGETSDALALARRAAAREPSHFATRMLEAELLGELGDHEARRASLAALSDEFPTRAEPAVALAEQLGGDEATPAELTEAARWFTLAIEREFDERVVLEFAALLERAGRIAEAIALLEVSHAGAAGAEWQEDFARALVRLHRERGQPEQAQRWVAEVEQQVAIRERGYAVAAVALMVILLAVVMIVLLLI